MFSKTVLVAALLGAASAYPSPEAYAPGPYHQLSAVQKRDLKAKLGTYQAPSQHDSRGPCPMLNTLANHGLLPRNGRNISSDQILNAMAQGPGINHDGIEVALGNFETVCSYATGKSCANPNGDGTFILANLSILAEPHAFEHDHSYSRQDFTQKYAHGKPTNNLAFNATEFQDSLDVIGYKPTMKPVPVHANYQMFNEIRLQRQATQYKNDVAGTFHPALNVMIFETGFIFGATYDRDTNGQMITDPPMVRVDWWNFWFSEESFPTQLGWVPAPTSIFDLAFITSVSRAVLAATVTSTPKHLPTDALNPSQAAAGPLPETATESVVQLIFTSVYVGPNFQSVQTEAGNKPTKKPTKAPNTLITETPQAPTKRAVARPTMNASQLSLIANAPPHVTQAAVAKVGPPPPKYDFYQQKVDIHSLNAQIAQGKDYTHKVQSAILDMMA